MLKGFSVLSLVLDLLLVAALVSFGAQIWRGRFRTAHHAAVPAPDDGASQG